MGTNVNALDSSDGRDESLEVYKVLCGRDGNQTLVVGKTVKVGVVPGHVPHPSVPLVTPRKEGKSKYFIPKGKFTLSPQEQRQGPQYKI